MTDAERDAAHRALDGRQRCYRHPEQDCPDECKFGLTGGPCRLPAPPKVHSDDYWIICPHCGDKENGAECRERVERQCYECGKPFTVDPEYSVVYHTFVTGKEKP
jgi:hypothetical protein